MTDQAEVRLTLREPRVLTHFSALMLIGPLNLIGIALGAAVLIWGDDPKLPTLEAIFALLLAPASVATLVYLRRPPARTVTKDQFLATLEKTRETTLLVYPSMLMIALAVRNDDFLQFGSDLSDVALSVLALAFGVVIFTGLGWVVGMPIALAVQPYAYWVLRHVAYRTEPYPDCSSHI